MCDKFIDKNPDGSLARKIGKEIQIDNTLARIHPINYHRPFELGSLRITFFAAGHIPGAAMTYIESNEAKTLYTGDYMIRSTLLTPGCILPRDIRPDTVVLCGTHAKHRFYRPVLDDTEIIAAIAASAKRKDAFYLSVNQLTKGIEAVQVVSFAIRKKQLPQLDIYVDDSIWTLAERLVEMKIPVLTSECKRFPLQNGRMLSSLPGVYIGPVAMGIDFYHGRLPFKLPLHGGYDECRAVLETYRPKNALVVHAESNKNKWSQGEHDLADDFPNTAVYYPQNGQSLSLGQSSK
jgi:Cft2 family RNA processing exonuclease